jgi:hypothetical protein
VWAGSTSIDHSRDAEIEYLKLPIAKLRRQQFGHSSEKREYQIELRLEELEARRTKETTAVKEAAPASTAVVRPMRRPNHLPRGNLSGLLLFRNSVRTTGPTNNLDCAH